MHLGNDSFSGIASSVSVRPDACAPLPTGTMPGQVKVPGCFCRPRPSVRPARLGRPSSPNPRRARHRRPTPQRPSSPDSRRISDSRRPRRQSVGLFRSGRVPSARETPGSSPPSSPPSSSPPSSGRHPADRSSSSRRYYVSHSYTICFYCHADFYYFQRFFGVTPSPFHRHHHHPYRRRSGSDAYSRNAKPNSDYGFPNMYL